MSRYHEGRQYQRLLDMHGVSLEFTDGALRAVARSALRRGTGARGLRTLLERLLTEAMFEVPDTTGVIGVLVDEESVNFGLKRGWAGTWGDNRASGLIGGARLIFKEKTDDDENGGGNDASISAEESQEEEDANSDDYPRAAAF